MSVEWIDTTFVARNKQKHTRPKRCQYCNGELKRCSDKPYYTRVRCSSCFAECHYDAGLNAWTWLTSILTTERGQNG